MLDRIALITGNADKAAEYAAMLGVDVTPAKADLAEIQSLDVAAVAARKAADAYAQLGEPVLVDDTGLTVHAWNGRCRRILALIDVATRQLPHPPVHDEPVTAHQQHPLATLFKHHGDRDTAHPEHVLREPRVTWNLNIRQAHPDMRRVIHQPTYGEHGYG